MSNRSEFFGHSEGVAGVIGGGVEAWEALVIWDGKVEQRAAGAEG